MGKPSAPEAPSPWEQANAQSAANEKAVYASSEVNAIPQTTPFGSVSFDYTSREVPEYDSKGRQIGTRSYQTPSGQTTTLAPQYQAILDQQAQFGKQLGDKAGNLLGQIPTDRFSLDSIGDTSDIAKTMYDRQFSLLKPQIEDQGRALNTLMSDRGIPVGAEIWNNEQDRFQRGVGESLNRLSQDSDMASRNEFQRQLQNSLLERQQPFSEFAALQGQVPNFPTPQANPLPSYNIQSPDISGFMQQNYQNELAQHQQQQAGFGSLLGGVLGMFSDERMKEDIRPVDQESVLNSLSSLPVSEWQYNQQAQSEMGLPGDRMIGPMAQDVSAEFGGPESVIPLGAMMGRVIAGMQALDKRTEHLKG